MADTAIYDLSTSGEVAPHFFTDKTVSYAQDTNGGSYSGQITFDTAGASNNGRWLSMRESYFVIPVVVALKSSTDITGLTLNPYIASIKSGFYQLIDSIQVQYNNTTIVQQTNYINQLAHFKLLTTWSADDVQKYGPSIGFFKDDSTSGAFAAAANASGDGISNNRVFYTSPAYTSVGTIGNNINSGLLDKLQTQCYFSDAASLGGLGTFYTGTPSIGMSNFSGVAGNGVAAAGRVYYWSLLARIRLCDICDFFKKVPLVKGSYYRIILTTNTGSVNITSVAAGPTMAFTSINQTSGNSWPVIVSSSAASQPTNTLVAGAAGGVLTFAVGINSVTISGAAAVSNNLLNNCRLYFTSYQMDPSYEEQYVSMFPEHVVEYEDCTSYRINGIASAAQFTNLLTNGVVNPTQVVVIPITNSASNGVVAVSELQSPFSTCPATNMPLGAIQNFQVQLANKNVFENQEQYDFSAFMDELAKTGVNGGQLNGVSSGLISQKDFQYMYRYYVADLSRRLAVDDAFPKSIQIQGINASAKIMDLIVFVLFRKVVSIRSIDGALVRA